MAKLIIRQAGDPVLREKALPVARIDKSIHKLLDNMAETMYAAAGVGLAAPQVGEKKRVVVIDAGDGLLELINPRIVASEGTQTCKQEGCLSFPGLFGEVERAGKIKLEAVNRRRQKIFLAAEGIKAQAIQHEIDHLDGILFIDRATSISKQEEKKAEG
ncbi:MAG: peptide deformylase [Acidaminococcales bacterium]|jgi:peptide deformylase|nr:peptide deformylase [Acidaminococcales bacterium]